MINQIPDPLYEKIKTVCPDDDVLLHVTSDITKDNSYGEEWLILTEKKIYVFSLFDNTYDLIYVNKISEIETIETINLTGNGYIEIKTRNEHHRIINYSNSKNYDFAWAVENIKLFIENKKFELRPKDENNKICETCHLPIPTDLNKCPRCTEKSKTLKRLIKFISPNIKLLLLILLIMIAGTCMGLITPYISKLFIDYILKANPITGKFDHANLLPYATLALLIAYVGQNLLSGIHQRLSGILGHKTIYNLRAAIYEKLQQLSLSYFDKHQVGSIMARVNQDTYGLQFFLVDFIPISIESLFILIGVGIFLFILSWQLTVFVLIPIIVTIIFLKKVYIKLRLYFRKFFHRRSRLSAFVNDSLSGMRVVKAFGQGKEELKKFDSQSSKFRDVGIELEKKWSLYNPLFSVLIMSGSIMVWFIGGGLVVGNKMTLGDVVAYSGYLSMFYRPVFILIRMIENISSSLSATERIFDIIDTEPEIKDAEDAISKPAIKGKIEFRNVTFGYDPFKPVIKDLNFEIQENEIIGLVGKSGAGKSTLINLVCRLYEMDKGSIKIDGADIKKIKQKDLRKQIGVVLQETFLFNGTIFDNIAYARPEATTEEVISAANAANAHEFILKKPDGYDTNVGERGNNLSGGEKQRIAIARAILRDPRILILDEATSSLDTETEAKIQQALKNLTKGRTTIAIAHRLSTLRNCHRLFVMNDGTLKEQGTHKELMAKKGAFYDLVSIQNKLSKIIAIDG